MEQNKKFKFGSIIFLGINSIVGAGIYVTPGKAYMQLGSFSLGMVLLCALLALIMALCFAEMAGKFTETGGPYVYVKGTFGPVWGFHVGFIRFIVGCIAWATNMVAIPTALAQFYPWFATYMGQTTTAVVLIFIISMINYNGVKSSEWFNNILTVVKFLPLLFFIITGIWLIHGSNFATPSTTIVPPLSGSTLSAGFLLIIYSFYGFENIGVAAQDMENPAKNIPKAIISVMIILTIVYFLIYFIVIGILGSSIAQTANPVATAMSSYLGKAGEITVVVASLISMFGFSLATAFANARNIVPLAKDHYMPESTGLNNKRGVPGQSIVIVMLITMVIPIIAGLISPKESFAFLVQVSGIGRFLQYLPVTLAVLKSRKLGIPGTFKLVWANILVPLSFVITIIVLLQIKMSVLITGGLFLIVFSLVVYYCYSKPRAAKYSQAK